MENITFKNKTNCENIIIPDDNYLKNIKNEKENIIRRVKRDCENKKIISFWASHHFEAAINAAIELSTGYSSIEIIRDEIYIVLVGRFFATYYMNIKK